MCFKNKREKIEKKNKDLIDEMLKEIRLIDFSSYFRKNLSSYRSEALRNAHYYGNIRVKYIGFNFSLLAIFLAYFGIYLNLNSSLLEPTTLRSGICLIILILPIAIYSIYFMVVIPKKSYTTSFGHSNLSHYKVFDIDYPKISNKDCFNKFRDLIKEGDQSLIKNDLRTLLKQYFYQANYQKVGVNLRICLYVGIFLLFVGIVQSFVIFFFC